MSRGGARNRSGPQPDPTSGRSDRRGLAFETLPAEGYDGEAPDFPLPDPTEREVELWSLLWTYPQAAAWARESWRWLTVGNFVRAQVAAEDHGASASQRENLHRFMDRIGLTAAGLKENGWVIARDELADRRVEESPRRERRLRVAADAQH